MKTKPILTLLCTMLFCSGCQSITDDEARKNTDKENTQEKSQENAYETANDNKEGQESMSEKEEDAQKESTEPASYEYEIQEVWCENEGQQIYGVLYIPDKPGELDLVYASHGLNGNYLSLQRYASDLARKGYAVYCFEFRGGGGAYSQGDFYDMSVMSEVSDLNAIIEQSKSWTYFPIARRFLLGQSQGGLVSAMEAARIPDLIAGLILLYPAFNIPDVARSLFDSLEEIPDRYDFSLFSVGYRYGADVLFYDPYTEIAQYKGPVLIIHGDADPLVPLEYSVRAQELYGQAELIVIENGMHGFSGSDYTRSVEEILSFLREYGNR